MITNFYEEIINNYRKLYEDEEGYDVKIYAGEEQNMKEFHVHSFILKAQSKYFKTVFEGNVQRIDGYFVLSLNHSPKIFKIFLSYMYCGIVDLTTLQSHQVLDLLLFLDEFQVQSMITYVQKILIENHNEFVINDVLEIIELTHQRESCNRLWDLCFRQICDNPDYLFKSDSFLTFNPSILEEFLKRDDINIANELTIWENLLRWAREQDPVIQPNVKKWTKNEFVMMERRLDRFIPLVRFYHISAEDFHLRVYPFKEILPKDLVSNVMAYNNAPNKKLNINIQLSRCASTIIKLQHFAVFAGWIDKKESFYYSAGAIPYDFKLLYRASMDGNTIIRFHEKCDNKEATIVVAKIKDSEQIVGGYNPLVWDTSGLWRSTKDSFLFTFANKANLQSVKISYSKGDCYSIHCGLGYGPLFGIGIDLGCNSDGTWTSNTSTSYTKINVPPVFNVDDYEVFQIIKK